MCRSVVYNWALREPIEGNNTQTLARSQSQMENHHVRSEHRGLRAGRVG